MREVVSRALSLWEHPSNADLFIKSGNVLGNRIPLTNLKLLVVGGLIRSIIECYGPLLCKVSGPRGGLVKHEEDGAGPKMAKRLRETLDDRATGPASA
jgi:hypothetical protein